MLDKAPGNGAPIGGIKVITDSAWFAARPSGTEDVYKIYAESFRGADHLQQVLADAQTVVDAALGVRELPARGDGWPTRAELRPAVTPGVGLQ